MSLSLKRKIKEGGIALLAVAGLLLLSAISADAAVLYERPYVGDLVFDFNSDASGGGPRYFYPAGYVGPSIPDGNVFYTLGATVPSYVKIWKNAASSRTCAQMLANNSGQGIEFQTLGGPDTLYANSVASDTSDACVFGLTNGTTGDQLTNLTIWGNSGIFGSGKFEGSENNGGETYLADENPYVEGVLAFQLCDSGGCSGSPIPFSPETRIVSFTPEDSQIPISNPVTFTYHAYVNPDDLGDIIGVEFSLHNIDQNVLAFPEFSPSDIIFMDQVQATTSGDFYFSTTTTLAEGNYMLEAKIARSYLSFFGNPFSPINDTQYHQFVVGSSTFLGSLRQDQIRKLNEIFASTTGTSTAASAQTCNPFSGSVSTLFYNTTFNPISCISFLLIPDPVYLSQTFTSFRNTISTHFPLGFVSDFLNIMGTTTVGTLTVFKATVPDALGFCQTCTITLDLTHAVDFLLNATNTKFQSVESSSTVTFFEFTSFYWNIFVYIGAGLYILRRVLGAHLVPHLGDQFQEMSGDKNVSDEAYRLKETLYNMSKRAPRKDTIRDFYD